MNRNEEFFQLQQELEQKAPSLASSVQKAKRRRRAKTIFYRPLSYVAAVFAVFIVSVNAFPTVAYACSRIPGLRELAQAVNFSHSLEDAIANAYVQPMDLVQEQNGIRAEVSYLIVDQKQVNIFYRLYSRDYKVMDATPEAFDRDGNYVQAAIHHSSGYDAKNGELRCLTIDFDDQVVPDHLLVRLQVQGHPAYSADAPVRAPDHIPEPQEPTKPQYKAVFDFPLDFDPQFTAAGKQIAVNQTLEVDGQKFTVTDLEIYPTHLRLNITEDEENTAWIKDLDFYVETDSGKRFSSDISGITATGNIDTPSMVSYRADSMYFYDSDQLQLVFTGADLLDKGKEKVYVNLLTGQTDPLPEGVQFEGATKYGKEWEVSFRHFCEKAWTTKQRFAWRFYDAQGNPYEINSATTTFGEPDATGEVHSVIETFYLSKYKEDEVWLELVFNRTWEGEVSLKVDVP